MSDNDDWSYGAENGPENWHQIYSAACGNRQSPIDINSEKLEVAYSYQKKKLKFLYMPYELNILCNTGYTWDVAGAENNNSYITGGPLINDYSLVGIHAHWSDTDVDGSEHSFNGKNQAAELHMVHQNKKYSTVSEAENHPEGFCLTATLLKIGKPHPEIQKVVDKMAEVMHKGEKTKLDEFVDPKSFLPTKLGYWTYMGSMTYPPCIECVVWVVFDDPVEVSKEQLQAFRTLRCHRKDETIHECVDLSCADRMVRNCRPTFNLGNRIILRATSTHAGASKQSSNKLA